MRTASKRMSLTGGYMILGFSAHFLIHIGIVKMCKKVNVCRTSSGGDNFAFESRTG